MENDARRTVLVSTYATDYEASMAYDKLMAAGIPCMLSNEIFSSVYPLTFSPVGEIRLSVFEKDYERACRVLSETSAADEAGGEEHA